MLFDVRRLLRKMNLYEPSRLSRQVCERLMFDVFLFFKPSAHRDFFYGNT